MYPDISKLRVESIGGRGGSSDAAKILQNHCLILKFDQNKAKSILGKVNRKQNNVASDFTLQGTYPAGVPFRLAGFVTEFLCFSFFLLFQVFADLLLVSSQIIEVCFCPTLPVPRLVCS